MHRKLTDILTREVFSDPPVFVILVVHVLCFHNPSVGSFIRKNNNNNFPLRSCCQNEMQRRKTLC